MHTVVVADEGVEVKGRFVPAAVELLEGGLEFVEVDVDASGVGGEGHCRLEVGWNGGDCD